MQKYKVVEAKKITPTILQLTLTPKSKKMSFDPGQYAAISFRRNGRPTTVRCFSIVSSPNSDHLQFAMRVQGDFTTAATELQPGDDVMVQGPFGQFVIDDRFDKNVLMLAGGIGVTPFMSMIRFANEIKLKIPITLIYSCRTQSEVPFFQELLDIEKSNPRFKVLFLISEGDYSQLRGARVMKSRISEDILNKVTGGFYGSFTHFVCGPQGFISTAQSILIDNNVDSDHLIVEAFNQGLIKEKAHKQKQSAPKYVYSLAGLALVFGFFFITALDLSRTVPKILRLQSAQTPTSSSSTTGTESAASTNSSQSTSSSSNSSSNSSSTNSNSGSNNSSSSTSTPSYSSPVTSVS
jgi:ferredoxin-NADP reductase